MKRIAIAIILTAAMAFGVIGCSNFTPTVSTLGNCTLTEARTATISTDGAKGVNVKGVNGSVKVTGRPGLKEARVQGTACANSEADLKQIKVTTERASDGWVRVVVEMPRSGNRKIDLTVEVPEDLPVMARNDNGTVEVSHLYRGANIRGDNGTLTITDIKGGATVESRNGAVTIQKIDGDLFVTRADNGILVVTEVRGDVTLNGKKNGAASFVNVSGDLTVRQKVNGLVTHTNIGGKVNVAR